MNLRKILGLALVAAIVVPFMACDSTTDPQPPPPPPAINTVAHYTKTFDGPRQTGLQSNDVHDVLVSSDDMVWIGNQAGAAVFNGFGTTARSFAFDQNGAVIAGVPHPSQALPNPKVRSIVELNGKIYVGTWGGGVGVYDIAMGPEQDWQILDESNGLVNDLVSDIAVDTDGTLIIATNGGVSKYDPSTGEFAFRWVDDNRDGIPDRKVTVEFTRNSNEAVSGDLLDQFVSAVAVAETPRGKEYWYCPRWESGIDAGDEDQHGITVTRGDFSAAQTTDTLGSVSDNTLYESATGEFSNGQGTRLVVGGAEGGLRRGLVKFDVASTLPPDAIVLQARFRLTNNQGGPPADVSLHRALADWGEGASLATGTELQGAPSETGDATWVHTFFDTGTWRRAGGDFERDASASIEVRSGGGTRFNWDETGTAADAQHWLWNPSLNFGWMVKADGDSIKSFSTRNEPVEEERPFLELRWSKFSYITTESSDLPEPNVNDILYDEDNDVFWLAFSTAGLAKVDVGNATWEFFSADHGLPSNVVFSIAKVNGVIWVGTQAGLARQLPDGTFRGYDRGAGIPADRVRGVYSDDPSRLWLSLIEAGAAQVNPASAE